MPANILMLLLFVLIVFGRVEAAESRPAIDEHVVVLRLYPQAAIDSTKAHHVVDAIADAFSPAVTVEWHVCAARETVWSARCDTPLAPSELSLRLIDGPPRVASEVLGVAVTTAKGTGQLATVYVDRVERTAAAAGICATMLLGRVAAHELAHLLLGQGAHRGTGLMRRTWSPADLTTARGAEWRLSGAQQAQLAAAVRQRMVAFEPLNPGSLVGAQGLEVHTPVTPRLYGVFVESVDSDR